MAREQDRSRQSRLAEETTWELGPRAAQELFMENRVGNFPELSAQIREGTVVIRAREAQWRAES
jgi:hypothetical protein